jgi:hypothetical protein
MEFEIRYMGIPRNSVKFFLSEFCGSMERQSSVQTEYRQLIIASLQRVVFLETNKHWNTDAYRRNTRVAVEHTEQLNSISRSRVQLNKEHTVPNIHTAVENRVTKLDLISEKMKFLKLYDFANLRVYIGEYPPPP